MGYIMRKWLIVWWFAVVSANGSEVIYSEHRTERACNVTRDAYVRMHKNPTNCFYKHAQMKEENT